MEIGKSFKKKTVIARIDQIPVVIDNRLYLILFLMSIITAVSVPDAVFEDPLAKLFIGLLTTFIFFLTVFAHEIGHLMSSIKEEFELREILLYPFGGVSKFRHPPDSAKVELRIAAAGPVVSLLLALIFLAGYFIFASFEAKTFELIFYFLFNLNILLTIFNLFPGYPLDGGRVLRAYLWKNGRDIHDATLLTGKAGQMIGVALILIGIITVVVQANLFSGGWILVMGIFLCDAATKAIKETNKIEVATVEKVMSTPLAVLPNETVQYFVDNILPVRRQTAFLVAQERTFYGILAIEDIKQVSKNEWAQTEIQKIMRPLKAEYLVEPETSLNDAKEIMRQNGVGIVGVVDGEGHLVGYLQRGKIRRKLK